MKPLTVQSILKSAALCALATLATSGRSADINKADNADNLSLSTSWVGGAAPTSADVAVWDSTITTANTSVLDVSTNWAGIRIASPVGNVTINSNTTIQVLGLGGAGIDMSAAGSDLIINAPQSNTVNQTWSITTGRNLTQNGPLYGAGRLTKVGAGTLNMANNGGLNGAFAGGLTIAEATVSTTAALNNGSVGGVIGTNTLILTNGGRLRFQNGSGTGGVNYNIPLQMDGAGTISFRANSAWGSPPITGSGVLTIDVNNSATGPVLTPTSFTNWNGQINFTSGSGGCSIRLATGFLNHSLTNASVNLANSGVGLNRQTASAAIVEIGTLSGAVGSSVNGNNVRTGWRNENSTFAGIFSGANGGLTKVGTGTLTLTSNSTHSLNTTVQGGKLLLVTGGSCSNSAVTVVTNGAVLGIQLGSAGGQWAVSNLLLTLVPATATNSLEFNFVGYPASTVTAPLLTRGGLTNAGPVNVSIKGGGWAVGTYPLISASTLGGLGYSGFALTNLPSGVLGYLTNDTPTTLSLVVTNSALPLHWAIGDGNWDLIGSSNWKDNNGATTSYQEPGGVGYPVQLDDTASGSSPITVSLVANVVPSGVTVNNGSKNYILTGANAISGGTPVTKLGSGTLTIQNNNTFTGGLNLNGGTLEFTADSNLGLSNSPIVFNGGALRYASGSTADISATRTVTFGAGGATIDDNGNVVTLSRAIGNNGAGAFTKTGSGSLTLTGINRYTGPTTIANGTLGLAASSFISNTPAINIAGSGTLSGTVALSSPVSQLLYGTGTVAGSLTVPASTRVSPATNGVVGILTNSGALTVSGGIISMDISTTAHDEIVVGGTLTFTSGTLALNCTDVLTNGVYRLFQCNGFVTPGSAANLLVVPSGVAQPNKALALSEAISGEIDLVVSSFRGSNIVWVGDNSLNYWDVENSLNWTNIALGTAEMFVSGDKVTFDNIGSTTPAVDLQSVVVLPGSITVNSASDYTFSASGSGKIGGTAGLTKSGSGTLTITTENNNTGGTLVNGGILQVGNGAGGDIGTGPVTNNSVVVFNQSADHTVPLVSGSGSVQQMGAARLVLPNDNTYAGSTLIGGGTLQVGSGGAAGSLGAGPVTNNSVLVFNRTGAHTVNNAITGAGTFIKAGTSTMTLGGANSYDGNTYVSNGVVKLGASERIPDGGTSSGWLILDGGATSGQFDLNGFNETVNALAGQSGASLGLVTNSSASVSTTNSLTLNQIVTTTFAGLIADNPTGGKVSLVMNGTGTLNISGNNPFSGGAWLNDGIVNATGNSPCGTGLITFKNATYVMSGSSFPGNNALVVDGGIPTLASVNLANGWGGVISSTNSNCKLNISTNVSFSAANLKQFSNYTGVVEIQSPGQLRWSASSGLLNGGDNAIFRITGNGTMFARNLGTISLGALEGDGFLTGTSTGGNANYIIGLKGTNTTFSGTISGTGTGPNTIIKAGPAIQTFSGTLSYDGATTISNGVLAITGTAELTNTAQINIRTPGTLDVSSTASGGLQLGKTVAQALTGSGTNLGFVTVSSNSAVRPGNGTADIGNLTVLGSFTNSGAITMELNTTNLASSATNDLLTATSGRVLGGSLIVTNVGPDLTNGQYFKLFSQPVVGAFATIDLPVSNAVNTLKYTWQTNLGTDGSITLLSATAPVTANTNAYLTSLVLTPAGALVPAFDSNVVSYTATEAYLNSPFTVTPTAADPGAIIQVIYGGVTNSVISGNASSPLALNVSPLVLNPLEVLVTAPDAVTVKSYSVNVTRLPSTSSPTLARTVGGGNLTLSWPVANSGWTLQTQTNSRAVGLRTNWFDVAGSTITNQVIIPIGTTDPTVFFRLFYAAP